MKKTVVSLVLLTLSFLLILIGFFSGGAESVWQKAITICLECIGIG